MTGLLTIHGAGSVLRLRDREVRRLVADEAIPFIRLPVSGGEIRFRPDSLSKWVERHEHNSERDIEQ